MPHTWTHRIGLSAILILSLTAWGNGTQAASSDAAHKPPPVLAGCEPDYPPYCMVTENGGADGFSVELLRAALKAVGREASFETGPWPKIKQDLAEGRIQALPLVGRTPEREAFYDFTFPYLTMHGAIVVREDNTDIHGPSDLRGKRVAVLQGDNAEEYLRRARLGAAIVPLPSFATALRGLSDGQYDAVVIQKLLAFQLMESGRITNLKIAGPPLKAFTQNFCFAVRKGDRPLLASLNEGLAIVMADGTFRRLYAKWFSALETMGRTKSRIIVGGDDHYPPYEFLDENGQPAGFNVDLTRAIARHLGLQVDIRLGAWDGIRRGLEAGDIDVVEGMFYSAERAKEFAFSPPFTTVQHVIVTRKGSPELSTMAQLAGKSILVMRGDIMDDLAVKMGYERQLMAVASQEDALRMLAAGKGDCALVARVPALYWIHSKGWKNLAVSDHPLLSAEYCYATLPGQGDLLSQFSEGLAALKATGEYHKIQSKWLVPYEPPERTGREVLKVILVAALPLLALLAGSLLWSWSLRRQVAVKTEDLRSEMAQRKLSEERYTLTMDALNDGIWDWHIPDGSAYFSGNYYALLGYEKDEFPANYTSWRARVHPEDIGRVEEGLRKGIETGKGFAIDLRMRRKSGEWQWFSTRGRTIERDAEGKALRMAGTLSDITERKRTEDALAKARELAAVGQLAAGLAHEVRNPLFALQTNAAVVARALRDRPDLAQHIEHMDEQVHRLADLIKDMLELGQPLSSDAFVECALRDVVQAAVLEADAQSPGASRQIQVHVPDGLMLHAAPGQLIHAFAHLLENALQHTTNGDSVEVAGQSEEGTCVVVIRDHGTGLPEAAEPGQVFEPFWTTRQGHRGLGLALARHYIGAHGGTVSAQNNDPPPGATFTVRLPVGK